MLEAGKYQAIPYEDLDLEDSTETWDKGKIYAAEVNSAGEMRLCGETTTTYYEYETVEEMKKYFAFVKEEGGYL